MLGIELRQKYLKALGFYSGAVDGVEGRKTCAAYLALQRKYFKAELCDGLYGKLTELLLKNAYKVHIYTKNFRLEEFRCPCGECSGYPVELDGALLNQLQDIRDLFGTTKVTSGLRCQKYNDSLKGSSKNSRHLTGKAADIITNVCKTESGRQKVMEYWDRMPNSRYSYCNIGGKNKHMGNAVHCDVR